MSANFVSNLARYNMHLMHLRDSILNEQNTPNESAYFHNIYNMHMKIETLKYKIVFDLVTEF